MTVKAAHARRGCYRVLILHNPHGRARPHSVRAAIALAKAQVYQDAADAKATLRAYAADVANSEAWCTKHGFAAMPAFHLITANRGN